MLNEIQSLHEETFISGQHIVDSIKNKVLAIEDLEGYKDILSSLEFKYEKYVTVEEADFVLNTLKRALTEQEEVVTDIEKEITTFKSYEGLLESTPQSMLQSSIQFRKNTLFSFSKDHLGELFTVMLSLISMTMAWTTLYLKMPYTNLDVKTPNTMRELMTENTHKAKQRLPFQSSLNMLWTLPLMAAIIVPRVLNFTFFFGSFMTDVNTLDQETVLGYFFMASTLTALAVIYSLGVLVIYKVKGFLDGTVKKTYLTLNWATGPFGACIVINPASHILMATAAVSTSCHLILLASFYIPSYLGLENMEPSNNENARNLQMTLILLASLMCSCFLDILSVERRRQRLGLWTRLGSFSCPAEDSFLWACCNNYPELLGLCNEKQIKKKDPVNLNGLHLACKKGTVDPQNKLLLFTNLKLLKSTNYLHFC